MNQPFRLDPAATCDACGCHGAFRFDGETLCADCYAGRGSCCSAEFSGRPCAEETCDAPQPPEASENRRVPAEAPRAGRLKP